MKYLLLLNRKFPYETGEAFLENEIGEIAIGFDRVVVFPSNICIGAEQTRQIGAENVEVYVWETKSLAARKAEYALRGLCYLGRKTGGKNLREKLEDGYFLTAAELQARAVCRYLDSLSIIPGDAVYVYSYWLYVNAKAAVLIKQYLERRGIAAAAFSRGHGFDVYEERKGYLPQRREILDGLDRVYLCSENGADYLRKKYSEYADKIKVSRLGTSDHGIGNACAENRFHLLSCSRAVPLKRIGLIIDALKILQDRGIQLSWTHLGGGELLQELKRKAERELSETEVCFAGTVSNAEVYRFYASNPVSLFINVSKWEGLPVSIMEAISFGIPVVATDVGGTGEIVEDGISGRLLASEPSAEEVADGILEIYNMNSEDYRTLRETTRKLWEERYQASANYGSFLKEVLGLV